MSEQKGSDRGIDDCSMLLQWQLPVGARLPVARTERGKRLGKGFKSQRTRTDPARPYSLQPRLLNVEQVRVWGV